MMATRLMKHDLHEMMLEWPVQNLAGESRTERNSYRIDNGYLKATFEEICTPFFRLWNIIYHVRSPLRCMHRPMNTMLFGFVPL